MAQCGGLGEPRGSRGVLDINRIIRLEPVADGLDGVGIEGIARRAHRLPRDRTCWRWVLQRHDLSQPGKLCRTELTVAARCQFGTGFGEHLVIVRRLEAINQEQGDGVALAEHVLQFERPVGGIHRDQHGPDARGFKLQYHPLRHVGRPHGQVLARHDSQCQQTACGSIDLGVELRPIQAEVRVREYQRILIAVTFSGPRQHGANSHSVYPGRIDDRHH